MSTVAGSASVAGAGSIEASARRNRKGAALVTGRGQISATAWGASVRATSAPRISVLRTRATAGRIRRRRRTRYVHEFESSHGAGCSPLVSEFSCTERINLGYEAATGRIPRAVFDKHRSVFRFGTAWTVRLESTRQVVWAGTLKQPHVMGDAVLLTAEGTGKTAERTIDRMLFQTRDASLFVVGKDSSQGNITVEIGNEAGDSGSGRFGIKFSAPPAEVKFGPRIGDAPADTQVDTFTGSHSFVRDFAPDDVSGIDWMSASGEIIKRGLYRLEASASLSPNWQDSLIGMADGDATSQTSTVGEVQFSTIFAIDDSVDLPFQLGLAGTAYSGHNSFGVVQEATGTWTLQVVQIAHEASERMVGRAILWIPEIEFSRFAAVLDFQTIGQPAVSIYGLRMLQDPDAGPDNPNGVEDPLEPWNSFEIASFAPAEGGFGQIALDLEMDRPDSAETDGGQGAGYIPSFGGPRRFNCIIVEVDFGNAVQTGDVVWVYDIRANGIVPYQRAREAVGDELPGAFDADGEPRFDLSLSSETLLRWEAQWPDYYPIAAMLSEIAQRIGASYRHGLGPGHALLLDTLPADFPRGPASAVLSYLATLAGSSHHWAIRGSGFHRRLTFGTGRRWTSGDREQPTDLVPLDRYDTVKVPYLLPDGQTVGFVKALADRPWLSPHRMYGDLELNQPFRHPAGARSFGQRVANDLRRQRWGGTGSYAWLLGPHHIRVPAALAHAGDHIHDPISGHGGQIEGMTKTDAGISVAFVGDYPVTDSILARRDLDQAGRGR